jgi:DNA polymerase-3 subunit gamma/tau
MLGTIDRNHVLKILTALADQDGAGLIAESERLAELAADFGTVLDELMESLQQIAVIQIVGGKGVDERYESLEPFAARLAPEDVQLYYQIALHGRRDLAYTRDARMGFEMTLLRMLAFRPAGTGGEAAHTDRRAADARAVDRRSAASKSALRASGGTHGSPQAVPGAGNGPAPARAETDLQAAERANDPPPAEALAVSDWGSLLTAAGIRGPARQLGDNCALVRTTERRIDLVLKPGNEHLNTERVKARLESGIAEHLGVPLRVHIEVGEPREPTPADRRAANENQRMRRARESIEQDPTVKAVQAAFGGVVEADTIQPIDDQ